MHRISETFAAESIARSASVRLDIPETRYLTGGGNRLTPRI
jgi:hypothetical protein